MGLSEVRLRLRDVLRPVVVAICCLGALWFLVTLIPARRTLRPRPVGLSEVTAISGVAFPASAQLVNSLYDPWPQGRTLWAEVAISTAEVDVFIVTHQKQFDTTFADAKLAAISVGSPAPDWWPDGNELALVAVSQRGVGAHTYDLVNVGVVRGKPDRALLYLFWTRGS